MSAYLQSPVFRWKADRLSSIDGFAQILKSVAPVVSFTRSKLTHPLLVGLWADFGIIFKNTKKMSLLGPAFINLSVNTVHPLHRLFWLQ